MKTFAFVVHPITLQQLKDFWPASKIIPNFLIKTVLKTVPPFKLCHIKNVRSIQGTEIHGYFIVCPLLPKQMLDLDENFVLNRIIAAGHIAERLGAEIFGLGGYTSIVGDKGYTIAKNLKIAVTSGNTLTAWSVFEAIYRTAKVKNLNLNNARLAIIGATGSIGSLCTRKFSQYVPDITITARHADKLERLKDTILKISKARIVIENDVHKAVEDADLVVTTTSSPEALLDMQEFKSGSIVCDVSLPKNVNVKGKSRKDITIIDGGIIKLPFPVDFGIKTGLPRDNIFACIAETMLLAFEEKFVNSSLGDTIALDQIDKIAHVALKHGFDVHLSNE